MGLKIPFRHYDNTMKILILLGTIIVVNTFTIAQTYFSSIPDFDGDKSEAKIFNVIPLEHQIQVIGAIHDSIVPGLDGGTWQIIATISYDGELLNSKLLIDSLYPDGFSYVKKRIAVKNDSICYIYDRRNIGNPKLNSYLIELNYLTGEIVRSKIIYDTISTYSGFLPADITLDKSGHIYLINRFNAQGPNPQLITVLDSDFNVLHQSLIPSFGRDNITKFTEVNSDGSVVLVGESLGEETSVWFESKLFRQVLDLNFNSIDYRFAPTNFEQTILGIDKYSVIESTSGDWIFASQVVKKTDNCEFCFLGIPYVVSISTDFSVVNWETRMFDGNINSSRPSYFIYSMTEVSDGYIFLGNTDGEHNLQTSALLGKVSLNGDSLWLKHIIPLQWDTAQAFWFAMQDIKTSPDGNILIGGFVSDGIQQIIVPWIAQLDKDGCMEPGCNTVSIEAPSDSINTTFSIYPNPATAYIGINCKASISEKCVLSIFDLAGKLVSRNSFISEDGCQIIINIPDEVSGQYLICVQGEEGKLLLSKCIIIE